MNMDLELLFRAIGLCFVLEGLFWAAFPEQMRRFMEHVLRAPQNDLRSMGLLGMGAGLVVLWLVSVLGG